MYRVLITDDEKIEREGIKFLLSMEEGEYEIHEAANGKQALNILLKPGDRFSSYRYKNAPHGRA